MEKKRFNNLRIVLARQEKSNKWLAEQLGKDYSTVSKWCTNSSQPSVEVLFIIARLLNVKVVDLLRSDEEAGL